MLLKAGSRILNERNIAFIDLLYAEDLINPETSEKELFLGVEIVFIDGTRLYFHKEEAELLRWYFTHPTSKVKDLKDLKKG